MRHNNILQITLTYISISLFLFSLNANAEAIEEKISACNSALNKADYVGASTLAEEILNLKASSYGGLLCKGRTLGAQGNYNEALTHLELALKQAQPGFEQILTHIFIGNLNKNNNKFSEALASYQASIAICEAEKLDKFKRINLNLIGDAHTQNKDLNAALASYTAASKLAMNDNERAEDYEHMAVTYSSLGKSNEAVENQLKATLMHDKSGTREQFANASVALGRMYEATKDFPAAENTYAKLLKFSKDNGSVYYETVAQFGLARTKVAVGDTASAKPILAAAANKARNAGEADLATEIEAALEKLNN